MFEAFKGQKVVNGSIAKRKICHVPHVLFHFESLLAGDQVQDIPIRLGFEFFA
jgi:hypothetical protein